MLPELIYSFFIGPVELLLEFIFSTCYKISGNIGISIVLMGLCLNFLILPIYNRADRVSEEKLNTEKKLQNRVDMIKKAFKGDERFMMLQALYKETGYSPVSSLLASFALLLEIPFFIAGYHMLSHLHIMQGVSFLCIRDLGVPDGIIALGSLRVNLLPILMTLINIISGMVYSKERSLREKIQIYGLAAIFLVLLYASPSGLVLYWTVNNLFSLFKNIIKPMVKTKPPKKGGLMLEPGKAPVMAALILDALFVGLYIPTDIVKSSVIEFIDPAFTDPLRYMAYSFALSLGLFVFWIGIVRYLSTPKAKGIIGTAVIGLSFMFLLNYFFFFDQERYTSRLIPELGFTSPEAGRMMMNLLIDIMIILLCFILIKNEVKITGYVVYVILLAVTALSVSNIISIKNEFASYSYIKEQWNEARFELSADGRNVVVIMLDRAAGFFVPYIFNEMPELQDEFDGFTYYPNTLSTGALTNSGAPGLYGGYGYTSDEIVKREGNITTLAINNALRVMPYNFMETGYNVTVSDPSYANSRWVPDLSIYDDLKGVDAYITEGRYMEEDPGISEVWERNFFCYGLFRTSPLILRGILFDQGLYNSSNREYSFKYTQVQTEEYKTVGYEEGFMDSYTVLMDLPEITEINEGQGDCFLMFVNYTAHDFQLLQEPGYTPEYEVDNTAYESGVIRTDWDGNTLEFSDYNNMRFYDSNAAAYLGLAEWFDYLRDNGIYDNTRIIVVSDHAYSYEDQYRFFNPVLMVKDFDAHGFSVNEEFMTNADTPLLAMDGVVDSPVDPYYGTPITDENKYNFPYYVVYNHGDINWYAVQGDVREESSFTLDQ